jgi:hypothetical protein
LAVVVTVAKGYELGPVPADPAARRAWEARAASIAAYREMYSYRHPDNPIGPEPSRKAPDQRAVWHQAFAVLGPADGPDVRVVLADADRWFPVNSVGGTITSLEGCD